MRRQLLLLSIGLAIAEPARALPPIGLEHVVTLQSPLYVSHAGDGRENYGWKLMEGTFCHDPDPVDTDCPALTPSCFDASYTPPLFEYDNSGWGSDACPVTGGFAYRGAAIAGLQGAYVFGDFCGGFVWALDETSPGAWIRTELAQLSMGLTSFGEDAAGEIYVTHKDDVYRVVPEPGSLLTVTAGAALLTRIRRRRRSRRSEEPRRPQPSTRDTHRAPRTRGIAQRLGA